MGVLRSLHIGVNKVDPAHYGTEAPLRACENDARDMQAIAAALNYETEILLTKDAISKRFFDSISRASASLNRGDTFLLTLACHGAQIDDVSGDEDDGKDETWCLYDRMVIDDEVASAFGKFKDGVRVLVVSDSCHSGTSTRMLLAAAANNEEALRSLNFEPHPVFRCIEPYLDRAVFGEYKEQYIAIQKAAANDLANARSLGADIILISGCQDNQTSADGTANGFFTENLKAVWDAGAFRGDFRKFTKSISDSMGTPLQVPNLFPHGPTVDKFLQERPFAPIRSAAAKSSSRKDETRTAANGTDAKGEMHMESMLHPSVYTLLKTANRSRGLGPGLGDGDRVMEGGCFVTFDRSMLDGKTDKEILKFFADTVAPEMCSNYFVARDAFSGKSPRGGSVSCTASTSGGGSVSCTGTWSF